MTVGIADIATDLVLVLFGRRQELSTASAPFGVHGAAIWGSARITLPALDIAPPAIFWAPHEIAIDAFHHVVFAAATGIAYQLLSNGRGAHNGASKAS